MISLCSPRTDLLCDPDEDSFRSADIAESVDVFKIHDFIDYRSTKLPESGERVIDILDGKHYAQISQRVYRSGAVVRCDGGCVKARELDSTMAVGSAHHRNFDALAPHSRDTAGPFPFDRHAALQGQAEFS